MRELRPDPLSPSLGNTYPKWLLPLLLAIIVVLGILGSTGVIKFAGQQGCEEAGGQFARVAGRGECLWPDEDEPAK